MRYPSRTLNALTGTKKSRENKTKNVTALFYDSFFFPPSRSIPRRGLVHGWRLKTLA